MSKIKKSHLANSIALLAYHKILFYWLLNGVGRAKYKNFSHWLAVGVTAPQNSHGQ